MAFTASIPFTDKEQATIVTAAAIEAPGATNAQIVAWIEDVAKDEVRRRVIEILQRGERESENLARRASESKRQAAWPVADAVEE